MMKFKSLFRKGHGSSGSGENSGVKVKNNSKVSVNHFESAVLQINKDYSEKPFQDAGKTAEEENVGKNSIFIDNDEHLNLKVSNENKDMELNNVRKQLEAAIQEKLNLENKLDGFVKTHGELSILKKEITILKEQRDEIQKSLILKLGEMNATTAGLAEHKNGVLNRFGRLPNSAPASIAPSSGSMDIILDSSEWDKHSSGSLSGVSVACLQDRIMQMEETHYSTSEELQATLQELADLQTQLTELQSDNERLGEEKGVLLESLCRQTEKLEDARTKVGTLQGLLLVSPNLDNSSLSDREQKLLELLKDVQTEKELLLAKQKELTHDLQERTKTTESLSKEQIQLKEQIDVLESAVQTASIERNQLETEVTLLKETNSSNCIEIRRLSTLLENARSAIEELNVARERQCDKSELEELINNLRKEKDQLETSIVSLQEQLSRSSCEVTKLKELQNHLQQELEVSSNTAKSTLNDLENKLEKSREDAVKLTTDLQSMQENYAELQVQAQCHLDDKRQLKAVLLDTQKRLTELDEENTELKQHLEDERKRYEKECSEWDQFQSDLLMTVRVANDIKTEAQLELERLVLENKQLRDKVIHLETQVEKLKEKQKSPIVLGRSVSSEEGVSFFSSMMNQEIRRKSFGRQDSRLSVKSLIESIENATKQAKTSNGPENSKCGSTSSLNSVSNHVSNTSPCSTPDSEFKTPLQILNEEKTASLEKSEETSPKSSNDLYSPLVLPSSRNLEYLCRPVNGEQFERKDPLQALVQKGGSKRNALLKWCQNVTAGYKNIDITNFSSSWNDGLALCALLHSYLPDKVPYDSLNPSDKKRNFSIAFDAAESVGIKTTLNLNDMIQQERPDWNQVMQYVTSIFRHFES